MNQKCPQCEKEAEFISRGKCYCENCDLIFKVNKQTLKAKKKGETQLQKLVLKRKVHPDSRKYIIELVGGSTVGIIIILILSFINSTIAAFFSACFLLSFITVLCQVEKIKDKPLFIYELKENIPKEKVLGYANKNCSNCRGAGLCTRCNGSGRDDDNWSRGYQCTPCKGSGICSCILSKIEKIQKIKTP
ncbi:MAG: hypothetical protein HWN65_14470 [Candidatus Helarchaeota archaeon]|nr:hypothetical protein [Candidatus Helarchaeota archaeon]